MTHNDFCIHSNTTCSCLTVTHYYIFYLFLLLEYETAHRRIMSYSFPGVPGLAAGGNGGNEKEREVRISSLIPMGSTNMVRINIHIVHVYTMQLCIASFQIWPNFPF